MPNPINPKIADQRQASKTTPKGKHTNCELTTHKPQHQNKKKEKNNNWNRNHLRQVETQTEINSLYTHAFKPEYTTSWERFSPIFLQPTCQARKRNSTETTPHRDTRFTRGDSRQWIFFMFFFFFPYRIRFISRKEMEKSTRKMNHHWHSFLRKIKIYQLTASSRDEHENLFWRNLLTLVEEKISSWRKEKEKCSFSASRCACEKY